MDLSADWAYLEGVAEHRLAHNKTARHVTRFGPEIEILGAAGELAARRYLGLSENLHEHFDGGADLMWRGYKVDVKATKLTPMLYHRALQWPLTKPIKAEIILLTAVDLSVKDATLVGYAHARQIREAFVNNDRPYPCYEIKVPDLHPVWSMFTLTERRRNDQQLHGSA